MNKIFAYIIFINLIVNPFLILHAAILDTSAKQAVMFDFKTQQLILDKNSTEKMKPASMAKLMTIYIVFEKIKNKQLSLEDKFVVSEKAWKKRGSRSFLEPGQNVTIEDLLRGVIIQSGNDASIVLAEGISGTEDIFAELMNVVAKEIGMKNTVFKNSTGWPDPDQHTTAYDLAILSLKLISEFPDLYKIFSETTFTFNGIKQGNRNPILYNNIVFGADGLKTGHTEESGYGLAASAIRKNLRLILVLNGLKSQRQRKEEASRLLNSAFREYQLLKLFSLGEKILDANVWFGEINKVPLVVDKEVFLLLNSIERRMMEVKVIWNDPIIAPVTAGQEVGSLVVKLSDANTLSFPVFVDVNIRKQGILNKINSTINYLIWGTIE